MDRALRLATSGDGEHPSFLPNHSYVGLCQVEQIGDGKMKKHEVGFFRLKRFPRNWLRPPSPTITLFSWRAGQLELVSSGPAWASSANRLRKAEEAIYQQVLLAAGADALLEGIAAETRMLTRGII